MNYYPFGMVMPGRGFSAEEYRFGFNGVEKSNEVSGTANHYEFKFREYDPRTGRFWSVDPLFKDYPWNSTYAFAENRVIDGKDLEGLEYSNATDKSGTYGPLTDEQATKTGATLSPGFKTGGEVNAEHEQKQKSEVMQHAAAFQRQNNITPQNPGVIKLPDLPADLQMAKQIGEGIAQGLAGEYLGLGVGFAVKSVGNIPVSLYRTFGGEARALGKFYTPVNPTLYGGNFSRFAGLPAENSGAFTIKIRTTLNNLDFSSFGLAKPIGSNTGRFVPEIKVLEADAVRVVNFRVNHFTNPTYNPIIPFRN